MSVPEAGQTGQSTTEAGDSPFTASSSQEKGDQTGQDRSKDAVQILDWDGTNDPTNPRNFSKTWKWIITGAALLGTLVIPLNGTSITVARQELNAEFNVSDATFPHSYWAVTSWSVGGAIFIIVGLPLMEDLGVRLGYLIFYAFFILMIIPQALAQNFATLLVTRFFSGGCVALLANTVASIIPDVWEGDKARSIPVGLYILFYLMGSTLGPPMFAGVVDDRLHVRDWRWIFYIQLIIYGALFPLFFFAIKETRANVILKRRANKLRKQTGKQIYTHEELNGPPMLKTLAKAAYRPIYLLGTEPVLMASTVWSAFSFGTVFLFTQSVEQVYTDVYGWEPYDTGYLQTSVVIGEMLGWVTSFYGTKVYLDSAKRNDERPGHPIPEARLYVSLFGSFVGITGGMFVYAWTSYPSIHWIAPTIGLTMVGFGIQTVVSAVADYIEDAYAASNYAASAISSVAAGENIVAGFLPLATQSMYVELGFQWASSLLGFIALVLSFAPIVFIWKGRRFRERSPFMLSGGKTFNAE
ncbi:hypothetical protein LTR37_017927 [Vermiconidia calcicola]|uniref:Uncharacterized protein n=1 Tax=Vermiconidia calcicola TaxID=1690605 RepID=A0ACC3MJM2_9PEZI|nr:hypothetical protein LTR37_017927 [Vermiconidia calcicola]